MTLLMGGCFYAERKAEDGRVAEQQEEPREEVACVRARFPIVSCPCRLAHGVSVGLGT